MPASRPRLGLVVAIAAAAIAAAAAAIYTLVDDDGDPSPARRSEAATEPTEPSATPVGPSAIASPDRHLVEPSDRAGRVSGTVTEVTSGEPVAEVEIVFRGAAGESTAHAGADGRYTLDLAPGVYEARAAGDDVASLTATHVAVSPDAAAESIDLEVVTYARIRGRVLDRSGAPLASVRVRHRTRTGDATLTSTDTEPIGEAFTGDDGGFTMRVPPGDVVLVATRVGLPAATTTVRGVLPGAEGDAEIVMAPGVRVEGVVADEGGAPVPGARVVITRLDGVAPAETATDSNGRFAFTAVAPSRVEIQAEAEGYAPSHIDRVDVPAPDHDAPRARPGLVVRNGLAVSGRVVDAGGAPIAGARVSARPSGGGLGGGEATTDADGRFRVEDLRRGTYDLVAEADGLAPARRQRLATPADGVELIARRPGGIAGTVTSGGEPVRDFTVRIAGILVPGGGWRATSDPAPLRFATLDGAYRIDDLAPGAYTVIVSARGHAPVEKAGLQIASGTHADGSADLPAGAIVTGVVLDAATRMPVSGARVTVADGHERGFRLTGPDGRFTLTDLGAGRRSLEVRHPRYAGRVEPVELGPGDTRRVEVALEPELGDDASP